eukprot:CAMPEP_0203934584 /NCGR_PEP_ID=MMETSP0359-20131031/72518_1 /ASSEMBLY_ACC=CAM_ASM_000338 /TAXON_ID=268821 /ORGANISM="Scrippsiella Hangoei, Strain SHTV-5" /LENGTH=414 /DNA_ID=CAMNT_0050864315 /DNA_START=43 /DNA_END=1287 /DNA_ORIENTATION=-
MRRSVALLSCAALRAASSFGASVSDGRHGETEAEAEVCLVGTARRALAQEEGTQGAIGLVQLSTAKLQAARQADGPAVAAAARADSETRHVAYVACGGEYFDTNARLSLRSFCAQAKLDHLHSLQNGGPAKRVAVHIVLDDEAMISYTKWAESDGEYWAPSIEFHAYHVHQILTEEPDMWQLLHRFIDLDDERPCASVKLFLPHFLPPNVTHLVYIDSDTRIVGSMTSLFEPLPAPLVWGMGDDDRYSYNPKFCSDNGYKGKCYYGTAGLNSGVIAFSTKRFRDFVVINESVPWLEQVEVGEIVNKFGDQDVINYIAESHKADGWTTILPCDANVRPWMIMNLNPVVCGLPSTPIILHGVAHAFEQTPGWRAVSMRVGKAVERVRELSWDVAVNSTGIPLTLCELSDCLNFNEV